MGSLTCRPLRLLLLLCEGDLEPLLWREGWQDHGTEDGLDRCPVMAGRHLVCLGKEVGSGQDVRQVGVLQGRVGAVGRLATQVCKPIRP